MTKNILTALVALSLLLSVAVIFYYDYYCRSLRHSQERQLLNQIKDRVKSRL